MKLLKMCNLWHATSNLVKISKVSEGDKAFKSDSVIPICVLARSRSPFSSAVFKLSSLVPRFVDKSSFISSIFCTTDDLMTLKLEINIHKKLYWADFLEYYRTP